MSGFWFGLTVVAAVGCGVVSGVFFAFSGFVMAALDRVPAPEAVRAMQAVNVTAVRVPLMGLLFGTAGVCVVLGVRTVLASREPGSVFLAVGAAVYLVGAIGVTAVANVPRNNALAAVDPSGGDADSAWASYRSEWTGWNHVRAVASAAASIAFVVAAAA